MKSFITAIGLGVFLAANCFADDIAITPTARIDLFNGKDFSGWKFTVRGDAPAAETWTVTNGVIHCTGRPPGYARTDSIYRDYKLTAEWRFVKIAPKADNTGIFVHINPPDKVWPSCVEVQGAHGKLGDLRMNGGATCKGHETDATKNADAQAPSNEKPPGEWNTFEVECSGDVIKLWTNGKLMNEITGCSASSGSIGIQSEGGEIEVRKMFLEPVKH
jgi:3-keto-disaccharide hydrolase